MKKIKYLLQLYDGIWSVPLSFFTFWVVGLFLQSVFGFGTGTYDLGFIQPLFLAMAVVVGATNGAVAGIYFTFRKLFRYLYGAKNADGVRWIPSEVDFLSVLTSPFQRLCIGLVVFFLFFWAILVVYLKLV